MTESMSDFAAAFASLRAAKSAAEAMAKATDAAARQQHQTEILAQIADAYSAVLSAQDERSALVSRIRELEALANIRERYKLVSLGAANVVAFAPRQPDPDEAPHYLCGNCLNAGKVSYFQQTGHGPYVYAYHCNTCDQRASVDTGRPRQTSALPNRNRGPNGWVGS